jgi:hypothetical protein
MWPGERLVGIPDIGRQIWSMPASLMRNASRRCPEPAEGARKPTESPTEGRSPVYLSTTTSRPLVLLWVSRSGLTSEFGGL